MPHECYFYCKYNKRTVPKILDAKAKQKRAKRKRKKRTTKLQKLSKVSMESQKVSSLALPNRIESQMVSFVTIFLFFIGLLSDFIISI